MNRTTTTAMHLSVLALAAAGVAAAPADSTLPPIMTRVNDAFDSIDTNRDGTMTFDEYRAFVFAAFADIDTDGNFVLTLREIGSNAGDRAVFEKIDRAKKGEVTLAEYMRMQRLLFDFADLDLDGTVSRAEYAAIMIASGYGWVDANGDHRLSRAEYVDVLANLFATLDVDRSGSLSPAEHAAFDATRPNGDVSAAAFLEAGLRTLPAGLK
ncbi:MAG: hypothetical protein JNM94_10175 [Phycisphaerae bacterium]|nr:hypothetical protein [Phycisphaerae bacterium]